MISLNYPGNFISSMEREYYAEICEQLGTELSWRGDICGRPCPEFFPCKWHSWSGEGKTTKENLKPPILQFNQNLNVQNKGVKDMFSLPFISGLKAGTESHEREGFYNFDVYCPFMSSHRVKQIIS